MKILHSVRASGGPKWAALAVAAALAQALISAQSFGAAIAAGAVATAVTLRMQASVLRAEAEQALTARWLADLAGARRMLAAAAAASLGDDAGEGSAVHRRAATQLDERLSARQRLIILEPLDPSSMARAHREVQSLVVQAGEVAQRLANRMDGGRLA